MQMRMNAMGLSLMYVELPTHGSNGVLAGPQRKCMPHIEHMSDQQAIIPAQKLLTLASILLAGGALL